jgi:site-specific DNA-methyltransferase (adenine-specific)
VSTQAKAAIYEDDTNAWGLIEGDALKALAKLPAHCVDAVVTDPPYAISLGGEPWDHFGGGELPAPEAFERWTARWAAECLRVLKPGGHLLAFGAPRTFHRLVAGVEDAGLQIRDQVLWIYAQGMPKSRRLPGGLGTTLKPAYEPILLARKPFDGQTSENIERYGTGALNIDATRIASATTSEGYWPAHLTLSHGNDCSEAACVIGCPVGQLDHAGPSQLSRLFFCAKATKQEREAGCEQLPEQSAQLYTGRGRPARVRRNTHPTVKPLSLMRWLVRLVTPEGGLVLDPFCGSGSTGAAAVLEDRQFLGIEREDEYVDVACARLTHWANEAKEQL